MRSLTYEGITWLDDASPTEEELLVLQKRYGFHDLDIEDCLSEHQRPKVEAYDHYLFLECHIPYLHVQTGRIQKEEVDIFLGTDFFVTIHSGRVAALDTLWHTMEKSPEARREYLSRGTGFFLAHLMGMLFDLGFPLIDEITKGLRHIEKELFEIEEVVDLLHQILLLRRNIIMMRSILLPHRTLITILEHKNKKFIPDQMEIYFDDILDAIERQWSILDMAKEMSEALQDTHRASLTHKNNAVIRILTIFSVILLPLTVLTGFYGMNIALPFQESPIAFLLLSGVMLLLIGGFLGYFSWRRWL